MVELKILEPMAEERQMFYGASPEMFERAKALRKGMTKHEHMLWDKLKSNQLLELRFKAQHPISSFIADFYCHKMKLVVEIDGASHALKQANAYDLGREFDMEEYGIRTIRFTNDEVEMNISSVIGTITSVCLKRAKELNISLVLGEEGFVKRDKQPSTPADRRTALKGGAVLGNHKKPPSGVGGEVWHKK